MTVSSLIGAKISGAGHGVALVGLLVGGWFQSAPPPVEEFQVFSISAQELEALQVSETPPEAETLIPTPAIPDVQDDLASASQLEDPEIAVDVPEPEVPETPDNVPEPLEPLASDPEPAETPEITTPDVPDAPEPIIAEPDETPAPQDAPRVAETPVFETPLTPEIADEPSPPVAEVPSETVVEEEQPEAAPEEATTEIVTEAETPGAGAPAASIRPLSRPVRQASAEETPATEPDTSNAIDDALNDALATAEPEPRRPTGPPLTNGEKDTLRVAVQQCWNVGSLSSEALLVTVIVVVDMFENGKPDNGSIRMVDYSGGSDAAARQAYEAARRAIIRCGTRGYNLPTEKYEQWREIEMTFNPERMRIK